MTELLWLYLIFLRIGFFTIGGGMAMDYYAIGQCTPGIIAVTVSAFIGWQQKKVLGAIIGPVAVALPGFVIVLGLSLGLGMRVAVAALVTAAVVNIFRSQVKHWWQLLIAVAAFIPVAVFGAHPAWVVASAALIGLFGAWRTEKKNKES
jgi:chromate transporter